MADFRSVKSTMSSTVILRSMIFSDDLFAIPVLTVVALYDIILFPLRIDLYALADFS